MQRTIWIASGLLLMLTACYNPTFSDELRCSERQTCPPGFVCDLADNVCRRMSTEPSCDDGQQNGDETGVDCGGACPPCAQSSAPGMFYQVAGGGHAASSSFQVQVGIGAPLPMGSASSTSTSATLGPTPQRP